MEANTSYCDYAVDKEPSNGGDRLPLGLALLAIFGLSALGWTGVLAPLLTMFNL
jgi:hypothetical protein